MLFATVVLLVRAEMPEGPDGSVEWLQTRSGGIRFAAVLMPFAGIAFLWFIAVVRDRLGGFEDRFFTTVFLGSGLLFLAMMFVSTSAAAVLAAAGDAVGGQTVLFGKMVVLGACQDLCDPDGRRVHDLAGHDLVQDGSNAAAARRIDLPDRRGAGGRR